MADKSYTDFGKVAELVDFEDTFGVTTDLIESTSIEATDSDSADANTFTPDALGDTSRNQAGCLKTITQDNELSCVFLEETQLECRIAENCRDINTFSTSTYGLVKPVQESLFVLCEKIYNLGGLSILYGTEGSGLSSRENSNNQIHKVLLLLKFTVSDEVTTL